ncbi:MULTISPECIES: AMIN domain-containing protein [unclassified Campylobacter]|uniref:AMIN domain-containing protein n=1 Tax=unclassified Campylobacter TaxID=2593542 RepID=UPI001237A255|nr:MULTISPECIES: AMIN domain-containing protein [unclassified Campylobacter]KAA6225121.1 AMIN domain-containing protein [Campylobacter sp. LR196d]KAA6226135.1 AMIN domain-containing protein [Campylobacter sp. LR185c]KAA6228082.1 AMIN domain-containing protein [Campylobacter sp. LR286c]KAA6231335.1 AMIN domain-containing protein [Campylobacter sp. LR264d]KAA6231547.1 AMIN domain-containing protein [Campylobacter sp. LR291e]
MKNKILLLLICLACLKADDNPFAVEQNASIVLPQAFQREEMKFNSDARILKSITFNYIKLDGTEESVSVDINKSIDWHETYAFSRSKTPDASQILDVSVTIPEKIDQNMEANSSINIEMPLQTEQIYEYIAYTTYKNKIKFNTQDEIISDFAIGNPSKIVVDFKSDKISPTKNIRLNNSLFKRIDFGSHKGYYRLVIYLDGKYSYHIDKDANGYTIKLF